MKKIVSIILALIVVLAITACGSANNTDADKSAEPSATATAPAENIEPSQPDTNNDAQVSEAKKPQISENKTVISENSAPKVYVIMPDMRDMSYHLENCPNLAGKDTREIAWGVVQTIGLWQCPTCNPPRYEGYKNAQ